MDPSTTGGNGRGPDGRFAPGNSLAKGNPHARRVAQLRSALLAEVTPEDLRGIIRSMIDSALAGDVQAARLILDRALGAPEALDLLLQVESMEERVAELEVMT